MEANFIYRTEIDERGLLQQKPFPREGWGGRGCRTHSAEIRLSFDAAFTMYSFGRGAHESWTLGHKAIA